MKTQQEDQALSGNEEYRSFIDKLTESNVDRYIDLPMIAVMGDTSSGKSSLLSNLSLIELPSSDELTTRCPIMLKMNRSQTRSATIQVVWKDTQSTPFTPEKFNDSNWADLTAGIARAQKHIVDITQKEVARDVVSVQVSGPHCEALTLVDLPGIVRSTGKGESESLAADIQSLIEDYLKNPRCVILAVHPSNVDFHNSQIMAEARIVDPQTKRTIPVLTKPDLIDEGAEQSVLDLLLGLKTDTFEKGFHMVKGRSQASLNKKFSVEDGLEYEEGFFRNKRPWRDVEDKNLLGTKNLRVKLSLILMQLIRDTFPEIVVELKRERKDAFAQYSLLGDIPYTLAEKRVYFSQTKDEIIKSLRPILLGGSSHQGKRKTEKKCAAEFHALCKQYQDDLHETKLANITKISVGDNVLYVDSDDEEDSAKVVLMTDDAIFLDEVVIGNSATYATKNPVGTVWEYSGSAYQVTAADQCKELRPFDLTDVYPDPNWIKELVVANRPYSLPVFVNSELFDQMISDFIDEQWEKPSINLVSGISSMMKRSLYAVLDNNTRLKRFPKLLFFMKNKFETVTDELTATTLQKVQDFISSEKNPFSQDHYLFENLTRLRSKRLHDEISRLVSASGGEDGHLDTNAALQIIDGVFERNQCRSIDDHMAEELMHILNAYGKVALKRFCDTVPMFCGQGILHSFTDRVNQSLSAVIDKELENALHVPSEEKTRRKSLKRRLETMDRALSIFDELF